MSRVRVGAADPQWAPLAIAWLVLLIVVHLHPFNFSTNPTDFQLSSPNLSDENTRIIGLRRVSLAPFVGYYWGSRYQALDNIARCLVSFAPLGVLLALAFGRREGEGELTTLAIAVFTAVGIEAAQYFIPERHPDVTDVLLHVAGAWLGYRGARHLLRALDAPSKEKVEEPAPPPLMALVPVPAVAGLWHPTLGAPPESAPRAKARPPLHLPRPYHRGWLSNLDQLPFWAGALVLGAIGLGLFTLALLILRVLD